jgi:hypothetical protein
MRVRGAAGARGGRRHGCERRGARVEEEEAAARRREEEERIGLLGLGVS